MSVNQFDFSLMSKFTILHISDLHKDIESDYAELLGSLESDKTKWVEIGLDSPAFIIKKDFKDTKIAVAGNGYVGISIATLLA